MHGENSEKKTEMFFFPDQIVSFNGRQTDWLKLSSALLFTSFGIFSLSRYVWYEI